MDGRGGAGTTEGSGGASSWAFMLSAARRAAIEPQIAHCFPPPSSGLSKFPRFLKAIYT
jgi:hypothetical protein